MVYLYSGIPYSDESKQLTIAWSSMDGSHKHNAEESGAAVEHRIFSIYKIQKKAKVTYAIRLRIPVRPCREGG